MRFSTIATTYLASAFALALAPHAAQAGVTAFSGNNCDGPIGADAPCDGSCNPSPGRHSFRVDGGSGPHCVTMFANGGCPAGGIGFTFQNQDGNCQNVNTGTDIQSFLCAPSNVCLL